MGIFAGDRPIIVGVLTAIGVEQGCSTGATGTRWAKTTHRSTEIPAVADKLADERAVVTLHADECCSCEWHTPFAETDEDRAVNADAQTDHARETGHRQFWHYTVQRGQSRLYFV